MSWKQAVCYELHCDRCGSEPENEDTGGGYHFAASEASTLPTWLDWHAVRKADDTTEHICFDCWDALDPDNPLRYSHWEQTGPTLLDALAEVTP